MWQSNADGSRWISGCVAALIVVVGFFAWECPARTGSGSTEYRVKAAYLYNFIRFTSWPDDKDAPYKPVIIGIVGKSPFGPNAFASVENKPLPGSGRFLVVKQYGAYKAGMRFSECSVLFICWSERRHFQEIIGNCGGRILTVGDSPGFAEKGGMLNLVIKDGKVRWEINAGAVSRSELQVSSQIYQSAIRVIKEEP